MFRDVLVFLTITGILACPLECMARIGGDGVPTAQQGGCSCCEHRHNPAEPTASANGPVDSPRRGPAPPENCDCICLCKGAVNTAAGPKMDFDEQMDVAVDGHAFLIAQAETGIVSLPSVHESPPPLRLGSGRMLRLVLASLLL